MVDPQDASKKTPLKVLLTASRGGGHVNSALGIGKLLVERGHDVTLIHFPEHRDKAEKQGFKFISLHDYKGANEIEDFKPGGDMMKEMFEDMKKYSPVDLMRGQGRGRGGGRGFGGPTVNGENEAIVNAINAIKPDVVLGDYRWPMAFMSNCPVPFIPIMSNNPLKLYNGPPLGSGISVFESPEKWTEAYLELEGSLNPDQETEKTTEKQGHSSMSWGYAEYLGIYIFPEALDYKELGPPSKNWVRLDQSIRKPEPEDFEIPDKLKDKPGKLIYVAMGTTASDDPRLIQMLIDACVKAPHRFIVSTGKNGDVIKLADNVWGDKFLKQINILPKVDLVVTHCGSNSLIESLYFGKPIVAIPVFDDQLDNGQRVADLKLGIKINMWEFTEERFVDAIEKVLKDTEIHERAKNVSDAIQKSSAPDKVISYIEYVAKNRKSPFE